MPARITSPLWHACHQDPLVKTAIQQHAISPKKSPAAVAAPPQEAMLAAETEVPAAAAAAVEPTPGMPTVDGLTCQAVLSRSLNLCVQLCAYWTTSLLSLLTGQQPAAHLAPLHFLPPLVVPLHHLLRMPADLIFPRYSCCLAITRWHTSPARIAGRCMSYQKST